MKGPTRTYTYRRWSGLERTVEADRVEFTPTHVVFWRHNRVPSWPDHLVLAEEARQVNELRDAGVEVGPGEGR